MTKSSYKNSNEMKRMLILGAPFDFQKGGAEYQYKILEEYLKGKYEIYYLFRHPEPLTKNRCLIYDYRFRKRYSPYLYTDALVIYRLIKSILPDIIYKRGVNYIAAIGAHYARLQKSRMILHISSQRNVDKSRYNSGVEVFLDFVNQNIAKYAIKNANKIICQAQYQNKLLQANYGRSCDLIMPNILPIPEITVKKTLPIKIIWISNFKQLKQPELFIDLADHFKNSHNIKFIMIGRPALGLWQKQLFEKIDRLPNLEFRGELELEQIDEVLRESHILVNTSKYEGFPNTYIQAWMRKVPVVALNSDPDDIIKTHEIGFHSKTFLNMVHDVRYLINNKEMLERMGTRAQTFSCNTFSTANIVNFVNLIEAQQSR